MFALPGVTPVTVPLDDTVAIAVLLELHATTRSGAGFPATSRTTAVSCTLAFCTTVFVVGCTLTLPTANLEIVTAAVPLLPSAVAVMVDVPSATAFSIPCAVTVATDSFELFQVTDRPVSTVPFASRATADNCVD